MKRASVLEMKMDVITSYGQFSCLIGSLLGGDYTDAILLVEEEKIKVHKCILAAHSEFFNDRFTSQQADNVIELEDTTVEVVRALLEYFYKGQYKCHENLETDLLALQLAQRLQLKENLEGRIIDHLVLRMNQNNFVKFYNLRTHFVDLTLELSCEKFLKENGEEFARSESFSELTADSLLCLLNSQSFAAAEIDIFRASERWADVNKPDENTVKEIVSKFRLATMSIEDLIDVVSKSEKFPNIDPIKPIESITKKDRASIFFRHNQLVPGAELNVAKSSLGAEVLLGDVSGADLISGSSGCTSHKVEGNPNCIVVKLDQIYRLNALEIVLDTNEGRSYKYHVEVSVDKEKWTKVVDHSKYWCRSNQFLRFDIRALMYIRMTGTDKDLKITSLQAMYTTEKCSLVKGVQVASRNVVSESRGATVTGGFENPMHCIDEEKDTYTVVKDDSPLIITLGQPYILSSLESHTELENDAQITYRTSTLFEMTINARGNGYNIETSTDREHWHQAGRKPKVTTGENSRPIKFSRKPVLHFKITVDNDRIDLYQFKSQSPLK